MEIFFQRGGGIEYIENKLRKKLKIYEIFVEQLYENVLQF